MKILGFMIGALVLAIAIPSANAQGATTLNLETHTEGAGGYFTMEGQTAKNPTLNAAPGESITVNLKAADDGFHNFCVKIDGAEQCSEFVEAAGSTATLTFVAPASGTLEYYCQPHKAAGMKGTMSFGGATSTPPTTTGSGTPPAEEKNGAPGLGLIGAVLALAAAVALIGRRN